MAAAAAWGAGIRKGVLVTQAVAAEAVAEVVEWVAVAVEAVAVAGKAVMRADQEQMRAGGLTVVV